MDDYTEMLQSVEGRFARIVNVKTDTENNRTSVRISGFKYDDFDRAGNLCIRKLVRVFEIFREADRSGFFSQLEGEEMSNVALIVLARHWTISRLLYDRAAINFPMILSLEVTGFGRSSVDLSERLHDETTGELLASCLNRGVTFNTKMQMTVPIPDVLRQQLSARVCAGDTFPIFRQPALPVAASTPSFTCSILVRYDDLDQVFHANNAAYIALMRECAAMATTGGFYSRLRGDVAFYPTQSLSCVYVGESFAGDELQVTTWEDAENPLLLYFVLLKQEKTVSYAKMLVFDNSLSKL
jgi:acyl-CoA thioesterase FadM